MPTGIHFAAIMGQMWLLFVSRFYLHLASMHSHPKQSHTSIASCNIRGKFTLTTGKRLVEGLATFNPNVPWFVGNLYPYGTQNHHPHILSQEVVKAFKMQLVPQIYWSSTKGRNWTVKYLLRNRHFIGLMLPCHAGEEHQQEKKMKVVVSSIGLQPCNITTNTFKMSSTLNRSSTRTVFLFV